MALQLLPAHFADSETSLHFLPFYIHTAALSLLSMFYLYFVLFYRHSVHYICIAQPTRLKKERTESVSQWTGNSTSASTGELVIPFLLPAPYYVATLTLLNHLYFLSGMSATVDSSPKPQHASSGLLQGI